MRPSGVYSQQWLNFCVTPEKPAVWHFHQISANLVRLELDSILHSPYSLMYIASAVGINYDVLTQVHADMAELQAGRCPL